MQDKKNSFLLSAILISGFFMQSVDVAAEEVEVNHLGTTNTLLKVNTDKKMLILPVQESVKNDAKINVIVDGKLQETIYVKLAQDSVDYKVPYDLTPFTGKTVVFDVISEKDNKPTHDITDDICWEEITPADNFDTSNTELLWRPAYHHTPLYGWMNDPNGMFYKDGVWHLYYQKNPYGSKWQNMTWGHSTSTDLINWEAQPDAIKPDALGAIFSGSAVVDSLNTAGFGKDAVIALYTSASTNQMQSLAFSNDNGQTFTTFGANPVITLETEARDPNMFWDEQNKQWVLVLAHALEKEILTFTSPDLINWTLQSQFGKGLGARGGVWECPDLFELQIPGTDKTKWVMLVNLNPGGPFGGSATQYFIGDFDGKTFVSDTNHDGTVPVKWLDFGKDHYATVSWSNAPENRRTVIGWMSNWEYADRVPTTQFRSANTLPRDLMLFADPEGELFVASAPSPELLKLRDKLTDKADNVKLSAKPKSFNLPANGLAEIDLTFQATGNDLVTLNIFNKKNEKVILKYDAAHHTLSFDRKNSGVIDFSEEFPATTSSPTFENDGKINLRIFIDRSSIETFGNNGQFVMTNLVFPEAPYTTLSIESENGTAILENLKIFSLKN